MGTTWNGNQEENKSKSNSGRLAPPRKEVARVGRDAASVWTRADKIGAVASLVLLAVLLVVSACSKEEQKPALLGATNPASSTVASSIKPAELSGTGTITASEQSAPPATPKKARRKLAANVTYEDANSGVSFVYPRKAALASAEKAETASIGAGDLAMNFVQPGGIAVASVALPRTMYAGTDFAAGLFRVNANRSVSADECSHFAFVDTSDADGEPIDAESVKVGATEMKMTSEFAGSATRQLETRYYHAYQNGACYEYVLGLSTAGFGEQGVQAVDRDEVFGRLEKILASVKIRPVDEEQAAQKQDESPDDSKEAPKQESQQQPSQKQESQKEATGQADCFPDPGK